MRIGTVCHSISWYSIIWTSNLIINLTIWLSLCGCSLQSFIQLNKLLWVVFGIYMPFRVHILNCVSKLMSISALISATVWNFLGSSHQDQKYFDRLCGLLNRYLVNHNNQQHKQSMKKISIVSYEFVSSRFTIRDLIFFMEVMKLSKLVMESLWYWSVAWPLRFSKSCFQSFYGRLLPLLPWRAGIGNKRHARQNKPASD